VKMFINILLVREELAISVVQGLRRGLDHIVSAPGPGSHPVTQVGYNAVPVTAG
jgi:hypothetical protein